MDRRNLFKGFFGVVGVAAVDKAVPKSLDIPVEVEAKEPVEIRYVEVTCTPFVAMGTATYSSGDWSWDD